MIISLGVYTYQLKLFNFWQMVYLIQLLKMSYNCDKYFKIWLLISQQYLFSLSRVKGEVTWDFQSIVLLTFLNYNQIHWVQNLFWPLILVRINVDELKDFIHKHQQYPHIMHATCWSAADDCFNHEQFCRAGSCLSVNSPPWAILWVALFA